VYELLFEDGLLLQVIADREAWLATLSGQDDRRTALNCELTRLCVARARLVLLHQRALRQRNGRPPLCDA
jgi:hypothetical protein